MLRNLLIFVVLVVAIGAATVLWPQTQTSASTQPSSSFQGQSFRAVPDFPFVVLDSKGESKLSDLKGKVILLNFWASWCAPCLVEFPQFLELAKRYPKDVVIVAVSVDTDEAALRRFLAKYDVPANVLIVPDPQKRIAQDLFQTLRYPETIMVAPDLTMREKIAGADVVWTGDEMIRKVDGLLTLRQ